MYLIYHVFIIPIVKGGLQVDRSTLESIARPRPNQDHNLLAPMPIVDVHTHANQDLSASLSLTTTTQEEMNEADSSINVPPCTNSLTTGLFTQPTQNVRDNTSSPTWEKCMNKIKDIYHQAKVNLALRDSPVLDINDDSISRTTPNHTTATGNDITASSKRSTDTLQNDTSLLTGTPNETDCTLNETINKPNATEEMNSSATSQSSQKVEQYSTMAENMQIVPKNIWNDAIQDHVKDIEKLSSLTVRKKFPKLWIVADTYANVWKDAGWHSATPKKGTSNLTNFKNKICNHVVSKRRPEDLSHNSNLISSILEVRKSKPEAEERAHIMSQGEIFVYEQEVFIDYALRTWRIDMKARALAEEPHNVNDIIRLVSVMALNRHRKDLLSLSSGKVKTRAEMDGCYKKEVEIFSRIAVDYNNDNVVLKKPKGANRLDSADDMDPNDKSRICLGRSPLFLLHLYRSVIMGEYKVSTYKWRKGTGGGPGAPEDFHKWNLRDSKLFANYGGGRGTRVKKDYLAYILMQDIECSYAFSSRFAPAPRDTVLEDTDQLNEDLDDEDVVLGSPKKKKARRTVGDSALENMGMSICGTIERVNDRLADTMQKIIVADTSTRVDEERQVSAESIDTQRMRQLNESMKLCEELEAREARLKSLPDDDPMKQMRLQVTKKASKEALKIMARLSKGRDENTNSIE